MKKIITDDMLQKYVSGLLSKIKTVFATKTEMNTGLNTKSDTTHNHDTAYYKKAEVDTKLGTKSDNGHNHDDRYFTESEMNTKLATKSDTTHNHDTAYYKKAEVDTKLGTKADSTHTHDALYMRHNKSGGLGASSDFNSAVEPGNYPVNSPTSIANAPFTGAIYGSVLVQNSAGTELNHTFLSNTGRMLTRFRDGSGVWTPWKEVFTAVNLPTWANVTGKPSTFAPSAHNHDEMYYTETEMNTKLAAKSDTTHNHDTVYYKKAEVDSKLGTKTDTGHTHDDRYYTESEMNTKLATKTDIGHTHDDRYYTESEVTAMLNSKIPGGVSITKEGNEFYINY